MVRDGRLIGREPGLEIAYYNPDVVLGNCDELRWPMDVSLFASTGTMYEPDGIDRLCGNCHGGCRTDPYLRHPMDYSAFNDADGDGLADGADDCPVDADPDQADADGDGIGDACDPCPGDGTTDERPSPTPVLGGETGDPVLGGVAAISVDQLGHFSMALKPDGTVWTWGRNGFGQLGDGEAGGFETAPVQVRFASGEPLTEVVSIAAGAEVGLVARRDGSVWAWGFGRDGALGNFSRAHQASPVRVLANSTVEYLTGVVFVAPGEEYSLASRADGSVWSWGFNRGGGMDPDPTRDYTHSSTAYELTDFPGFELQDVGALAVGWGQTLALASVQEGAGGTVRAWGESGRGQTALDGMAGVRAIAAGHWHSLALRVDGSGWNCDGQLGIDVRRDCSNHLDPLRALIDGPIVAIGAGNFHSLAIRDEGGALSYWAWGANDHGQLGLGAAADDEILPVEIPAF